MEEIIYLPKITKSGSNHHIEYLTCYTVGFFPLTTTSLLLKRDRMRSIASDARIPSSSSAVLLISLWQVRYGSHLFIMGISIHNLPFSWSPIVKYTSSFSLLLFLNIINSSVFVIVIIIFFFVVIIIIVVIIR